ncbi:hypothetical protein NC653_030513 [Populus alba x Populus x berolinensis]|uniref:non-specific serine/threonine protein kinase n=1 Tax=Populus alba x Populus x berolinensis TaxID=444605 RepID=A0AAD6LW57_9ROSI|nr:hypothetical protein NC653_030513 [Populus alba x Populus x berolinensis]
MAAVGGHNKAAHSTTLPLYGCVPLHALSFGEGSKEYCLLSERNLHAKVSVKPKKHSPVISSSASSIDLRASDMERERQDGLSPRGVIEACLTGLESNSDFTRNSTAESEVPRSKAHSNWSRFFKSWKRFSLKHLPSFIPPPVPKEPKRKSRSTRENTVLRNLYNFKSTLQHFTFAELKMATNNFNHENLIGKGGFAEVYKGCLPDGRLVAIKQLTKGTLDEKTAGFLNELGIIAHVDHPNTAKLLGCGIDGGMHLVFELSPLGSLGSALHGSQVELDWSKRYKIALGAADGLLYLHENCRRRIIHRDIKADNILLTKNFEPQICDFGLAKWLPTQWTHHNVSKFEGTFGYFAPEYYMHGIVDEKTDIYAFGVLLLELITGRRPVDHLQQSLVIWAKPLLDNNDTKELADPSLGNNYDLEEMDRVVLTASLCIEQSPVLRPRMSQASVELHVTSTTLFHAVLYSHITRNHRVTVPFAESVLEWLHIV